jgi:hypothetical protein
MIHSAGTAAAEGGIAVRVFSLFQCFQAGCALKGNVLDLWAATHRLPLYEAALHLAGTFQVPRTREEEPVTGTRCPGRRGPVSRPPAAVATTDQPPR